MEVRNTLIAAAFVGAAAVTTPVLAGNITTNTAGIDNTVAVIGNHARSIRTNTAGLGNEVNVIGNRASGRISTATAGIWNQVDVIGNNAGGHRPQGHYHSSGQQRWTHHR